MYNTLHVDACGTSPCAKKLPTWFESAQVLRISMNGIGVSACDGCWRYLKVKQPLATGKKWFFKVLCCAVLPNYIATSTTCSQWWFIRWNRVSHKLQLSDPFCFFIVQFCLFNFFLVQIWYQFKCNVSRGRSNVLVVVLDGRSKDKVCVWGSILWPWPAQLYPQAEANSVGSTGNQ